MAKKKEMRKPRREAFAPPAEPVNVYCLHCGCTYTSDKIEWKQGPTSPIPTGGWCCPLDGCDGAGYGYDILPDQSNRFSQS
ncbi:MAG TPA: hypothetical protein DCM28_17975 [Phycisphaerales bacterium]|nr:hypothetical protein [Phycisphaerales bacterium]|tara:strand:+ start:692 stop:934 length:243 start_codon:yes stop_codon:yes gene_type:complete